MILIYLISAYFILVFVGIRLIVPYYGFGQSKVTEKIPKELLSEIKKISLISKNNLEFLKNSYDFLTRNYYGSKVELFTKWRYAFDGIFTHKTGFIPCNVFNELLRVFLIKSGRFEDNDIRKRVTLLNFFIHQYLQVNIDGKWIDVDMEYKNMDVPFGKHASIFG